MSVYSSLKLFKYSDRLQKLPNSTNEAPAPVHIRLKPTNVCNHSCFFCAYRREGLQLGKDMQIKDYIPREKMLELVDDFTDMGVKAVTFTGGGEPLVYKYIDQTAEALANNRIKISLLTNGSLLQRSHAEIFAEHAKWIRVSLDGYDGKSYAKSRNCSDNEFNKVLKNIENFKKKSSGCTLGVSYIINRDNSEKVFDMCMLLKDHGVDNIKLSPCIMGNTTEENNKYHASFFNIAKDQCKKAAFSLSDKNCEIYDSYEMMENKFFKSYTWCPMMQLKPVVAADQNVYACQDKAYNLDTGFIGSIKNTSFKDFWFNNKEKFFSLDPSRKCSHHCVANDQNKMIHSYLNSNPDHMDFI